jgi:hypothetical protein
MVFIRNTHLNLPGHVDLDTLRERAVVLVAEASRPDQRIPSFVMNIVRAIPVELGSQAIDWNALAHAGRALATWCADQKGPERPLHREASRFGRDLARIVAVSHSLEALARMGDGTDAFCEARSLVAAMAAAFDTGGRTKEDEFDFLSNRLHSLANAHHGELSEANLDHLLGLGTRAAV